MQHFCRECFLVCFFDANHAKFRETMRKTNFSVVSRRFMWFASKIDSLHKAAGFLLRVFLAGCNAYVSTQHDKNHEAVKNTKKSRQKRNTDFFPSAPFFLFFVMKIFYRRFELKRMGMERGYIPVPTTTFLRRLIYCASSMT